MVSEKVFGIDKLNTIEPHPAKRPIEGMKAGRNEYAYTSLQSKVIS